jgi:hypothetical protein
MGKPANDTETLEGDRLACTIEGACYKLSLSRSTIYKEVELGCLHPIQRGGRVLFTDEELRRYLSDEQPRRSRRGKRRQDEPKPQPGSGRPSE